MKFYISIFLNPSYGRFVLVFNVIDLDWQETVDNATYNVKQKKNVWLGDVGGGAAYMAIPPHPQILP